MNFCEALKTTFAAPFDIELARQVISGKIKGKFITRDGNDVEIIALDVINSSNTPVVASINTGGTRSTLSYHEDGYYYSPNDETDFDLLILLERDMGGHKFKDGDILTIKPNNEMIILRITEKGYFSYYAILWRDGSVRIPSLGYEFIVDPRQCRLSNDCEKARFIKALKDGGNIICDMILERFFGIKEDDDENDEDNTENEPANEDEAPESPDDRLKPFQGVIVRSRNGDTWIADIFSNVSGNDDVKFYCCVGGSWEQCLPFEGNEKLLGTNIDPE